MERKKRNKLRSLSDENRNDDRPQNININKIVLEH